MEDPQKYFLQGCFTTIFAFALLGLLASIFLTPDEPKENSKFKVLDQYQGCLVIQYTDPTSRWHYFLKCS
jgi:hypothetical protein